MAPPRTVMRQTDDTVSTGLRQLLCTERAFVETLRAADAQVARRLRFCGARNVSARVAELLASLRELAAFHALFADKLAQLLDDAASTMAQIEAVLEDLLLVTRVVYAPLHARRAQFKEALDAQLQRKTDDAAVVLREFLQASKLTSQQFVALPVKHLHDLIERADIIVGSPSLTQTCEATKTYLTRCEQEATNEAQLIALQAQLRGSALEMDLCGRDLLCRAEVTLSRTVSDAVGIVLDQSTQPLHDVYCLEDGTVLFVEKASHEKAPPTGLCINLKNDAVFLEPVPRSVGEASHPAATILAGPSSSLLVSCKPEASVTDFHAFVDSLTTLLAHNDRRTQQLKRERTVDDLELPDDLKAIIKSPQPPLVAFPSFHDDELPGLFWMHDPAENVWHFVELVQFASSMLIFAVSGWRRHHLIRRIDLEESNASVSEAPRSHDNWSLRISTDATAGAIDVVSERRARIDFWYDQMSKTIDAAVAAKKKREEQEARAAKAAAAAAAAEAQAAAAAAEAQAAAAEAKAAASKSAAASNNGAAETDDGAFINVRAKKRQRNTTPVAEPTTTSTTTTPVKAPVDAPLAEDDKTETKPATNKKRRSVKASPVADAVKAAERAPAGDGEANESTQPDAPSTSKSATKRQRTPPVKTPKQRWVRRKTDDPDDEELVATQPGEAGAENSEASADEPVSEPASSDVPKDSIRIIFTGIEPTPKTFKKINAIPGAVYEENIENATHVIAPKNTLKRTVKLLCGISVCDHILDERWLDESARLRTCVYERQYCLKDAKAESKWGFDLVKTMYDTPKDQRRRLFDGRRFYITQHKTVLPPVQDLVKIVEQAGGSVATSGPTRDGDLVITSEAAMATAAVAKVVAKCERVYSPELILSSILQQRLDLSLHGLSSAAGKTPPRSRGAARS